MAFFIRGDAPFVTSEFDRQEHYVSRLFGLAAQFLSKYECEYTAHPDQFIYMAGAIRRPLEILERLKLDISQITFIDLGCGCDPPIDVPENKDSLYPHKPYFARVMHHFGAKVIGIDKGPLNQEPFIGYSLDLMQPNSLNFIPSGKIDVVYSSMLECSPSLDRDYGPERGKNLSEILFPQIIRVLKPTGYCISDFSFKSLENLPELRVQVS
ncbi:MAG: hypothetical protein AABX11_01495 [Nanoarchaeota archaeon]